MRWTDAESRAVLRRLFDAAVASAARIPNVEPGMETLKV